MEPSADPVVFDIVDPGDGDALAALDRYFAHLGAVFPEGFDRGSADGDVYRPPGGAFVLGRAGGAVMACGALHTLEPGVGEIKRMWVDERWRGRGVGTGLVAELERIAAGLGHRVVRLDTNRTLTAAIALYERLGYRRIERYNDNPYAHHWFEKRLS